MLSRTRFGALLLGVAIMLFAGVAAADGGLGQSWPNAQDQSRSGVHHAYRWDAGGVEYVQVNDQNGAPQLAVATGNAVIMLLPIGNPQNVVVSATPASELVVGRLVYQDAAITVQQAPDATYVVSPTSAVRPACDPAECTRPPAVVAPATTSTATPATSAITLMSTCNDPAECTRINVQ